DAHGEVTGGSLRRGARLVRLATLAAVAGGGGFVVVGRAVGEAGVGVGRSADARLHQHLAAAGGAAVDVVAADAAAGVRGRGPRERDRAVAGGRRQRGRRTRRGRCLRSRLCLEGLAALTAVADCGDFVVVGGAVGDARVRVAGDADGLVQGLGAAAGAAVDLVAGDAS